MEITLRLGAEVLVSSGLHPTTGEARAALEKTVATGEALERLRQMVAAQGGDLDAPRPVSPASDVPSPAAGYIAAMDAEKLGDAVILMGGGRVKKTDTLDLSTGFEMLVRVGDRVDRGQPLARLFATDATRDQACGKVTEAIKLSDDQPAPLPLVIEEIQE